MDVDYNASCCAIKEINDLSGHSSAESAMIAFCRESFNSYSKTLADPGAFIMFSGVVGFTAKHKCCDGYCDDDDFDECHCKEDCECQESVTYGPDFAAYIKEHKLGPVWETRSVPNRLNHPDHKVKVWLWAPNLKKLQAWHREVCSDRYPKETK